MIASPVRSRPTAPNVAPAYWDDVAGRWRSRGRERVWRTLSDRINHDLLERWLPGSPEGSVLKTDLFDELVGPGIVPKLFGLFASVTGIDVAPQPVEAAVARYPLLRAEVADVRALPFATGSFDAIVSNSTLDHLSSHSEIAVALGELHRVLRPGGSLLITLDNPVNPVVAVRNALPERLRSATHLVPFAVGATCGPARLRAMLSDAGFALSRMSAISHSPRALVVLGGYLVDRTGPRIKERYLRLCWAFERLAALPSRYLTGYFVAALAHKR
jgi:SAM-dependent methyltransferase